MISKLVWTVLFFYILDYTLSDDILEEANKVNEKRQTNAEEDGENELLKRVLYIVVPLVAVLIIIGVSLCYILRKNKKNRNGPEEKVKQRFSTDTTSTRVSSYRSLDSQYVSFDPAPPSIVEKSVQPMRIRNQEGDIANNNEPNDKPRVTATTPGGTTASPKIYRSEHFHFTTGKKGASTAPPSTQYNVVPQSAASPPGLNKVQEELFDGELEEESEQSVYRSEWVAGSRATLPLDKKMHGYASLEDISSTTKTPQIGPASSKLSLASRDGIDDEVLTGSRTPLIPIDKKLQATMDARKHRSENSLDTEHNDNA